MPIFKDQNGWWISGVRPYVVEGRSFSTIGPYPTELEALEIQAGLQRFSEDNPEHRIVGLDLFGNALQALSRRPSGQRRGPRQPRQPPSCPGQLELPGM